MCLPKAITDVKLSTKCVECCAEASKVTIRYPRMKLIGVFIVSS